MESIYRVITPVQLSFSAVSASPIFSSGTRDFQLTGHRRKIQREVARRHLWPDYDPLPADGIVCECPSLRSRARGTVKGLIVSKL
jgi:hypothetical protein